MAVVKPFRAWMPTPEQALAVSAVPYDVVNTQEARELAGDNPLSFLHVSRPEIQLPDGADSHADAVYALAAANFEKLIAEAPLTEDAEAHLYVYELTRGTHVQTGICAACAVDDYDADIIKKHEKTRKDKEDDRTRHVVTTRCHSGPVFLLYRAAAAIDAAVATVKTGKALYDLVAEDGVRHVIWRVPAATGAAIEAAFAAIPALYVADGHHRAKSASRAREEMRAANPQHTGDEAYNRFLAVLFPHNQLKILSYNRAVHDLNGLSSTDFLARVAVDFHCEPTTAQEPTGTGRFQMYLDGSWYALRPKQMPTNAPIEDTLDVSLLQNGLLAPILGIDDPRTNTRIDFVGGIRGTAELVKLVDSGRAAVAFSMYATTIDQLIGISDAGSIMPPKSTWFEPKLRDGLLLHRF